MGYLFLERPLNIGGKFIRPGLKIEPQKESEVALCGRYRNIY